MHITYMHMQFFTFAVTYPYPFLLISDFVFLFLSFLLILLTTRHILQFTMFDIISLQLARNIQRQKIFHSP